ncbi:hypothetical protein GH5_02934 [Leishmania sp. Ghana 2012 LV757]|uniref:hypothetical protein n=1 Tax=Leishmania sp. Ghana 2012 LV757 TaxID=2803181 RepID=UPI001B52B229|nr:hypothetical protein GH5_02934 [Leishmania sp. Ghana 2012 LV757]
MEGSKKYEDAALRGITRHHVWKSRTSDLTVISLRDPSELLGIQELPAAVLVAETKQKTAASPPTARTMTGKQESLNALLAKLQLSRQAQEPLSQPAAATKAMLPPPQSPANIAASAAPSAASPQALPQTTRVTSPTAAHSPASVMPEVGNPSFPDPKESSSGLSGRFEFITGTNIPGQGVVKKTEVVDDASSMALFHDPLWGGALDAFTPQPPLKPSPKPQLRTSLSELYASVAGNTTNGFASPSAPAPQLKPATSPPAATVSASPMPTPMASSTMTMVSGIVQPPTAPQLSTSYPLYTMPIQYMAQHPQFSTGMVYNAPSFFPYGGAPMAMAQPQHIPQGYPIPAAAMMRPGTNVKAMPFVPGNTM